MRNPVSGWQILGLLLGGLLGMVPASASAAPGCAPPCLFPAAGVVRHPEQAAAVTALLPSLSACQLQQTVLQLSALPDRGYNTPCGRMAAEIVFARLQQMARQHPRASVAYVEHGFAQPSVLARIGGNGPDAEERVILGGHLDSIGGREAVDDGQPLAPGADDDASGVAVLLEIFRVLTAAQVNLPRSLEFIVYAAEEVGLLGSQQIASAYARAKVPVAGVMQLDMTMYPGEPPFGLYLVEDWVNPQLTDFVALLAAEHVDLPVRRTACGYPCSDHVSWTTAGYPSVFAFESDCRAVNPHIHSAQDTWGQGLDACFGLQFARLGLAFAVELALLPGARGTPRPD